MRDLNGDGVDDIIAASNEAYDAAPPAPGDLSGGPSSLFGDALSQIGGSSRLYAVNGAIGTYTHLRGVYRKPGGFSEPTYNFVMGPPLLAPGSLCLVGALGMAAAIVRRERR